MAELQKGTITTLGEGGGTLTSDSGESFVFENNNCRVPFLDRKEWDNPSWSWFTTATKNAVVGDRVVFEAGEGQVLNWGHVYDGLETLFRREVSDLKMPLNGREIYNTRAGTLAYPKPVWGKTSKEEIEFESDPRDYQHEVINFVPAAHPQQWERIKASLSSENVLVQFGRGIADDDDFAPNGNQGNVKIVVVEKYVYNDRGAVAERTLETVTVHCHRDGTVRLESWVGPTQLAAPLTQALLESAGFEVVAERRPITALEVRYENFEKFCREHKPTEERGRKIAAELRERFGWNIYPPETVAKEIAVPVGKVVQDFGDFGVEATKATKVALIGVYDPAIVRRWEALVEGGLSLKLSSSLGWGPGTSASGIGSSLPAQYSEFHRVTPKGRVIRESWNLLGWGKDEKEARDFRARFDVIDYVAIGGARMVIGVNGQVANLIG